VDINKYGVQPRWMKNASSSADIQVTRQPEVVKQCSIDNPDCEACQ